MFTVATATATRRLRDLPGATVAVVLSCGVGAAITIGIVVGFPTLTRDVRFAMSKRSSPCCTPPAPSD